MYSFSIAIRSLGKSPTLKPLLEDIFNQSVKPDKVIIFIPEGVEIPSFRVESEIYLHTQKGMMHQRLLPYKEISSDYLLMLDDDVALSPDSVEKLLNAMQENNADLVGADTFQNHKLPLSTKIMAAVTNLVFPHTSQKWAFKIHGNGSFSYIANPRKKYYPSQSCAGNAMLWKMEAYRSLKMQDELWLDALPFAYFDDMLESYKVFKNGLNLGIVVNSGIAHLDARSASDIFRTDPSKFKYRTMAQIAIWWRTSFKPGNTDFFQKSWTTLSFSLKMIWSALLFFSLSLAKLDFSYISNFMKGVADGWNFVHSESFSSLPPYVVR